MHDFFYTGTGGYGTFAIYFNTGDAITPTEISNNLIYSSGPMDGPSGNGTPAGIQISSGGNVRIYHNSIYLSGACLSSGRASYSSCISVCSGAAATPDIRDNILKNSCNRFPAVLILLRHLQCIIHCHIFQPGLQRLFY